MTAKLDAKQELAQFTGSLIRRAQQRHVAVWQRIVSTEITSVQYAALVILSHKPGVSQREVCDELDLDRSTIADLVTRMARNGLIERSQSENDKRRKTLRLTPEGQAQLVLLRPRVECVEQALTTSLNAKECIELRRLLRGLLAGGM